MKLVARTLFVLMFGALASCATTPSQTPVVPWPEGAAASAARFEHDLRTLASDEFEGRAPGTPGYDKAVDYIVKSYREIGLAPAGDGRSYLQQVPLRRAFAEAEKARVIIGGEALQPLVDFLPSAARTTELATAKGDVVFVGYGIDAPSFGETAYEELDVRGKIVAVLPGVPEGLPSEERAHFNSFTTKRQTALAHGAVGMIALLDRQPNALSRARQRQSLARPTEIVRHPAGSYPRLDVVISLYRGGADALFANVDVDMDALYAGEIVPMDLETDISISTQTRFEDYTSPNVIGMIKGSDPALKDEYVVLTAHLDHLGILQTVEENVDRINNGAMDNASGTSTLLEEARKFMADAEPPRRSILFVALTAEEKGLLGSEYFARHPTVPQEAMVANVNLDMPILKHEFTDAIAFGAEHSTIKPIAERAGASMGVKLSPDPVPQMVLFTRSDHYNFVKVGVPSIFLFLGFENGGEAAFRTFMATNYHRPSDDADQGILWDMGAKFAELNYRIAREIANADEKPVWNEDSFFGQTFGRKTGM